MHPSSSSDCSDVLHEGWLSRPKSIFFGGNTKCFVVIDRHNISQYKSVEERHRVANPTEVTELIKIRSCVRRGSRRFALQLMHLPSEKKKVVNFLATNQADNETWLAKVELALKDARKLNLVTYTVAENRIGLDDMMTRTTASVCSQLPSERSVNLTDRRAATLDTSQPYRSSPSSQQRISLAESHLSNGIRGDHSVSSFLGVSHSGNVGRSGSEGALSGNVGIFPVGESRRWEPGTRVQFGQMNRFGIIQKQLAPHKFLVRVEGRSVIIPLAEDLLSFPGDIPCLPHRESVTSASNGSHEPPPPQHLASELGPAKTQKSDAKKMKKIKYVLRHLMVEKYTSEKRGKDSDDTEHECSICCMEYDDGDERLRLPCLHVFHNVCVRPWFREHESCPVCDISVIEALSL